MAGWYRMDGSPYPPGEEGLFEWAQDFEDTRGRIIRQELLWNGLWVSTVWLGLDHRFSQNGPPLIFESMVFNHLEGIPLSDLAQVRYSTLEQAERGHSVLTRDARSIGRTLRMWWSLIWQAVQSEEEC